MNIKIFEHMLQDSTPDFANRASAAADVPAEMIYEVASKASAR